MAGEYVHPSGERLTVPGTGGHALVALGWELVEPKDEPETPQPAPKRGRAKKTEE